MRILASDVCWFQPYEGVIKLLCVSAGFLSFDLFSITFLFVERNKLAAQTQWHHIFALCGLFGGFYTGYSIPNMTNATLLTEASSIFMNIKDLIPKA